MVRRLLYIAKARIPTQKAHGFQIAKMCEAFARAGLDVTLLGLEPWRSSESAIDIDSFDYFALERNFDVELLPEENSPKIARPLPSLFEKLLFFLRGRSWAKRAVRVAQRHSVDIFYTRDIFTAAQLGREQLPFIYEVHSLPQSATMRRVLGSIAKSRSNQLAVAVTEGIARELRMIGFRNVLVQHDGVDLSMYAELPEKDRCRELCSLPADREIAGYLGRFQTLGQEKGIPEFIEALSLLPPGERPLGVCVGGPLELVAKYRAQMRACGLPDDALLFFDRVSSRDVPLWLKSFDVAVAPFPNTRHFSDFMSPLKFFEYMASELPIVSTDLVSVREVFTDGEDALLVPPGDVRALKNALRNLFADRELARRIAKSARVRGEQFTWQKRVSAILAVLPEYRSQDLKSVANGRAQASR